MQYHSTLKVYHNKMFNYTVFILNIMYEIQCVHKGVHQQQ